MMNMMFSYREIHKTPYDINFCELDDLGHSRTSSFSGQFAREQGQYMLILQLVTVHSFSSKSLPAEPFGAKCL